MKTIKTITALMLLAAVLSLNVFAAYVVPSITEKDSVSFYEETVEGEEDPIVAIVYNEDGTVYDYLTADDLIITPISHVYDEEKNVPNATEETLLSAKKELSENSLTALIPAFEGEWTEITGGAPLSHAVISDIFDVRFADGREDVLVEGRYLVFSIKVENLTEDSVFLLIHKNSKANEWAIEEYEIYGNDLIVKITVDSLSPFAIVLDSEDAPEIDPNAPDSPQTSDVSYAVFAVIAAAVLFAAIIAKKRAGNRA